MSNNTLRNNGLSIAWIVLFLVFLGGQAMAGHRVYNNEQQEHGEQAVPFGSYLGTGHFGEVRMVTRGAPSGSHQVRNARGIHGVV
jgi:hypothetical protein